MNSNNSELHKQDIECLRSRLKIKIKRMFGLEEKLISFQWISMARGDEGNARKMYFSKIIIYSYSSLCFHSIFLIWYNKINIPHVIVPVFLIKNYNLK